MLTEGFFILNLLRPRLFRQHWENTCDLLTLINHLQVIYSLRFRQKVAKPMLVSYRTTSFQISFSSDRGADLHQLSPSCYFQKNML